MRREILKVTVNNMPEIYEKYVVARYDHNELWFWGSWKDFETAEEMAREVDGIVLEK